MKILVNNGDSVSIVTPTPQALKTMSVEEIATKDVGSDKTFAVVEDSVIPLDRTFRDAWESVDNKSIVVSDVKATDISKNIIRRWREKEFYVNDVELQNAIADGDNATKVDAIARRNYLRDLPASCDGLTSVQLKSLLLGLGAI